MLHDVDNGGHRFDRILERPGAAASVRRFTVATLMMATLQHANEDSECNRSQRIERLSRELPDFLQLHLEEEEEEDSDTDSDALSARIDLQEVSVRRLIMMLPQWIQA